MRLSVKRSHSSDILPSEEVEGGITESQEEKDGDKEVIFPYSGIRRR
jgi:hypothetical protein